MMYKKFLKANAMTILILIFGIMLLFITPLQIRKIPSASGSISPRAFPYFCAVLIILCSLGSLIAAIINLIKKKDAGKIETDPESQRKYFNAFLIFLSILAWYIVMPIVGFIISTAILIVIAMLLLGNRNKLALIIVPLAFSFCVYVIFKTLLNVALPEILF